MVLQFNLRFSLEHCKVTSCWNVTRREEPVEGEKEEVNSVGFQLIFRVIVFVRQSCGHANVCY